MPAPGLATLSPRRLLLPLSTQPFVFAGLTSATLVGVYKLSSLPELPMADPGRTPSHRSMLTTPGLLTHCRHAHHCMSPSSDPGTCFAALR